MPSASLDPLSLGVHDKRPKATCELLAENNTDPNLLEKGQSQYEAGKEESEEKESEKETSPSDPAASLKSKRRRNVKRKHLHRIKQLP